jgi:hypothetical protein
MHPARVLPLGEVRAAGGVSAQFAPGSLQNALVNARANAAGDPEAPGAPGSNPTFAKGALVSALIGPGVSPFVSARVGIGSGFEGGLAYTGRGLRVDIRHAWHNDGPWTYSLGVGASATLYGRQQGEDLPNVDLGSLHGYGADIPFLAGWRSLYGTYELWFGPRIGGEHDVISALTSEPGDVISAPIRLDATRFDAGGLVGFSTGYKHVHVAVELDVSYQYATGSYNQTSVTVTGLTIAPATALWFTF